MSTNATALRALPRRGTVAHRFAPLALSLCLALGLATDARAQALTPTITYQGELRLASGPANGNYDFQFRLYNAQAGGSPIGNLVSSNAVAVNGGLFAVPLDFGAAQFAGDRQWLEIAIRPAGGGAYEILSPRTEVTAAPYAWGAAVALANSVTTTSLVDGAVQASDIAAGAIGTTQINAAQVQARIAANCAAGSAIRSVAPDGTVVCETAGQGPAGPAGPQGLTGPQGPIGPQGPAGSADAWSRTGNSGTSPGTHFIGTLDAQAFEVRTANARSLRIVPSSITFGTPALPITTNTIGGSHANEVSTGLRGATIAGGGLPAGNSDPELGNEEPNSVLGDFGTVGGGYGNRAHRFATIGGGRRNVASADATTVAGGENNRAFTSFGTIGGGLDNRLSGQWGTVGGGSSNEASASSSTVSGGSSNFASGFRSTVAGGILNTASGQESMVAAGFDNCAGGAGSWAGGRRAKVRPGTDSGAAGFGCDGVSASGDANGHEGTFAWADDSADADFVSSGPNQFLVRASGGIGFNTNDPGTAFDLVANRAGHAMLVQNDTGTNGSGIAIRVNLTTPNAGNNFLSFQRANGSNIGAIEGNGAGGVVLQTSGADYAEYLPLAAGVAKSTLRPGMVVAIRDGAVSLDTAGSQQLGVVSTNPAVSGNDPGEAKRDSHALVAFLGQVDVAVSGPVAAGDYLIASGRSDGTAIGVPPAAMTAAHLAQVVGRAWTGNGAGEASVRALVGLNPADAAQSAAVARLESKHARLLAALERLGTRLEALEREGAPPR
ncbi:MAG: hypothetical protein ACK57F_12365 [Pseudomonadota bacterium]